MRRNSQFLLRFRDQRTCAPPCAIFSRECVPAAHVYTCFLSAFLSAPFSPNLPLPRVARESIVSHPVGVRLCHGWPVHKLGEGVGCFWHSWSHAKMAAAAAHSVYNMSEFGKPNFGDLGKPTITVDVARLQTELRALHQRIEMLEVAAVVAAEERIKEEDLDGSGSSAFGGSATAAVAVEMSAHAEELDSGSIAEESTTGTHGESHRSVRVYIHYICNYIVSVGYICRLGSMCVRSLQDRPCSVWMRMFVNE